MSEYRPTARAQLRDCDRFWHPQFGGEKTDATAGLDARGPVLLPSEVTSELSSVPEGRVLWWKLPLSIDRITRLD